MRGSLDLVVDGSNYSDYLEHIPVITNISKHLGIESVLTRHVFHVILKASLTSRLTDLETKWRNVCPADQTHLYVIISPNSCQKPFIKIFRAEVFRHFI